jgi:hypothetical protein
MVLFLSRRRSDRREGLCITHNIYHFSGRDLSVYAKVLPFLTGTHLFQAHHL